MNSEIESTLTKITPSGLDGLVHGIFYARGSRRAHANSRDVEYEYEPLPVSPAEQVVASGVIR
jgi:hypothetical protein